MPANSLITETIPGTTGSSPDGATFLDNLFGAGASAPTNRYFSLSLERSEDVRTVSSFGIGEVDSRVCPPPCAPKWQPILPHPKFGRTGYLHWRLPLESIQATFFNDPKNGVGPTTRPIPLGSTRTDANSTTPVAVLDSGGVGILVNNRDMLSAIYGAFGVEADDDGKCECLGATETDPRRPPAVQCASDVNLHPWRHRLPCASVGHELHRHRGRELHAVPGRLAVRQPQQPRRLVRLISVGR